MDYLNWSSIPSSKLLVLASYTSNFSPCNHRQSPTIWRHQRFSVNGKNVHKACCDAKEKLIKLNGTYGAHGAFIIAVMLSSCVWSCDVSVYLLCLTWYKNPFKADLLCFFLLVSPTSHLLYSVSFKLYVVLANLNI